MSVWLKRLLALLVVVAVVGGVVVLRAEHWLSWHMLARHQAQLLALAADHPVLAPVLYMLAYAVIVTVSLPEGALLTVIGGLLFGTVLGTCWAVLGASLGAVGLFVLARPAFGAAVEARAGHLLARIRPGLERDGFSYLLTIRLIPIFPFWMVNLAAALVGMRPLSYAAATLIGIIPSTLVFAAVGSGLETVLASGGKPDLAIIFQLRILGPLLALAVLALLPVLLRHWRRRRRTQDGPTA